MLAKQNAVICTKAVTSSFTSFLHIPLHILIRQSLTEISFYTHYLLLLLNIFICEMLGWKL